MFVSAAAAPIPHAARRRLRVMLTFFAIANALWQNCAMCKQKANACNKGCTTCQGGGGGPPPPPPPVRL